MKNLILFKIVSFLLILTLLVPFMVSCKKETAPVESQNETTATVTTTEEVLSFVTGGSSSFTIGRPSSDEPSYVFDYFSDVRDIIKKNTGLSLEISYDDNENFEVLIGSCGRKALDEIDEKYRAKDCFVGVYKNKLIIYGSTESSLKKAVDQFKKILEEKAESNKSEIKFSSTDNFEFLSKNYAVNEFKIAENSLKKYCIVYAKNARYSEELFALKLKTRLENSVGFSMTIYTDDKVDPDAHKILIGKTKYSSDVSVNKNDYKIEVNSANLVLSADSIEGYSYLLKHLQSNYLTLKSVLLDEGFSDTKTLGESVMDLKENPTGDIRVVFNNILGNCDDKLYPVSYRTRSVTELLASFNADVFGLQECSPTSRARNIVSLLDGYGYKEVPVTPTNSKKSNYTPLFYNPATVKVVDCNYVYYNGSLNDGGSKSITWAVFEKLDSGDRFAVCSTHFFYQKAADGGDAGRLENAKTLTATVKEIAAKYNVPVILGGDLNTKTSSAAFASLVNSGMQNIQQLAKVTDTSNTHHAYPEFSEKLGYYSTTTSPTPNVYTSSAIDHALVYNKGSLTFSLFDIITEELALMSSDHCPLVIDFSFAK